MHDVCYVAACRVCDVVCDAVWCVRCSFVFLFVLRVMCVWCCYVCVCVCVYGLLCDVVRGVCCV